MRPHLHLSLKYFIMPHWEIVILFFIIAAVYASVGFGGGSSYLAILAVSGIPFAEIRFTALLCNIVVVSGGTYIFMRKGLLDLKKMGPLVLASIPFAFWGAKLRISQHTFFVILGFTLIATALLLWFQEKMYANKAENPVLTNDKPLRNALLGGGVGFLSGMVGIGGGIFLSPALHFQRWDEAKKIAATASVFILCNSLAGIAGQLANLPTNIDFFRIGLLACATFAGGQIGSRVGVGRFDHRLIRRVTAVLVCAAGVEVLIKHL